MEFKNLPSQPPPYSEIAPVWQMAPTAPPNEQMQPAPIYMPCSQAPAQVQNIVIVDNPNGGMICPHCNARVCLRVKHHATCCTYVWAALFCVCFCWLCVCLPCCCHWAYKTSQFCPNCKACLGRF